MGVAYIHIREQLHSGKNTYTREQKLIIIYNNFVGEIVYSIFTF